MPASADMILKTAQRLLAQVELLEELGVFRQVVALDVIKQLPSSAGHGDQAAAGVKILPVGPEVLGQRVDPRREQSDLDLAGAGVRIVDFELRDDVLFLNLFWHVCSCCTTLGAW